MIDEAVGLNWETNYQYILNEKFFLGYHYLKKKNQNIIKLGNQVA